tara:strand:+ start:12037 stop:12972 length:936 start_codon:yes stop_codon:yes gene_type:complete
MAETWYNHLGLCADYSVSNIDLATSIGAQWLRTAPEYGWGISPSTIKTQTDTLRTKGMKHLAVVQYNAGGTKPHSYDKVLTDPTVRAAFIKWVASLAPYCDAIEIGNEWNLTAVFWQGTYDASWKQQAKLMYDVAIACKKANSNILLVTAGMSPYGNDDGGTVKKWPQTALPLLLAEIDRLAKLGGLSGFSALFAGIGQHLYEAKYNPTSGPNVDHPGWWAVKQNRLVWSLVSKYGVPIWNTEFGQKRIDFTSDTAAATHMGLYFQEFESQKSLGINIAMHIVISKSAFDGDWTLDPATKTRIKQQSVKVW